MNYLDRFQTFFEKFTLNNKAYAEFIRGGIDNVVPKVFNVSGMDYVISHFLDFSGESGFDIAKTNEILRTESKHIIAIALVEGDDVICINTIDNSICLWLVQSKNGECIKFASSFEKFMEMAVEYQ